MTESRINELLEKIDSGTEEEILDTAKQLANYYEGIGDTNSAEEYKAILKQIVKPVVAEPKQSNADIQKAQLKKKIKEWEKDYNCNKYKSLKVNELKEQMDENPYACICYGNQADNGKDYNGAIEAFQQAIKLFEKYAKMFPTEFNFSGVIYYSYINLGATYGNGLEDYTQTRICMENAVETGFKDKNNTANKNLILLYEEGLGCEKNIEKANVIKDKFYFEHADTSLTHAKEYANQGNKFKTQEWLENTISASDYKENSDIAKDVQALAEKYELKLGNPEATITIEETNSEVTDENNSQIENKTSTVEENAVDLTEKEISELEEKLDTCDDVEELKNVSKTLMMYYSSIGDTEKVEEYKNYLQQFDVNDSDTAAEDEDGEMHIYEKYAKAYNDDQYDNLTIAHLKEREGYDPFACLALANLAYNLKRYDIAIGYYKKEISLLEKEEFEGSALRQAYNDLGNSYYEKNDYTNAFSSYQNAREMSADGDEDYDVVANLAHMYETGKGCTLDKEKAVALKKEYCLDDASECFNVALMYARKNQYMFTKEWMEYALEAEDGKEDETLVKKIHFLASKVGAKNANGKSFDEVETALEVFDSEELEDDIQYNAKLVIVEAIKNGNSNPKLKDYANLSYEQEREEKLDKIQTKSNSFWQVKISYAIDESNLPQNMGSSENALKLINSANISEEKVALCKNALSLGYTNYDVYLALLEAYSSLGSTDYNQVMYLTAEDAYFNTYNAYFLIWMLQYVEKAKEAIPTVKKILKEADTKKEDDCVIGLNPHVIGFANITIDLYEKGYAFAKEEAEKNLKEFEENKLKENCISYYKYEVADIFAIYAHAEKKDNIGIYKFCSKLNDDYTEKVSLLKKEKKESFKNIIKISVITLVSLFVAIDMSQVPLLIRMIFGIEGILALVSGVVYIKEEAKHQKLYDIGEWFIKNFAAIIFCTISFSLLLEKYAVKMIKAGKNSTILLGFLKYCVSNPTEIVAVIIVIFIIVLIIKNNC